jgi:hypothetical protein
MMEEGDKVTNHGVGTDDVIHLHAVLDCLANTF